MPKSITQITATTAYILPVLLRKSTADASAVKGVATANISIARVDMSLIFIQSLK